MADAGGLTRADFLAALASRGIKGEDAETALEAWRTNPLGSDPIRVQLVLAHMAGSTDGEGLQSRIDRALAVLNGAPIPMGEVRARHAAAILRGDRG